MKQSVRSQTPVLMSYAGHLDVGIVADREQMPDGANLVPWLEDALVELEKAIAEGATT